MAKRKATQNGWKTCSRGHKYRGAEPCPVCNPSSRKPTRTKKPRR